MRFDSGSPAVSPAEEWMARVNPFLLADAPHQECTRRARDQGILDVNLVCTCPPPGPCTKECCVSLEDEL